MLNLEILHWEVEGEIAALPDWDELNLPTFQGTSPITPPCLSFMRRHPLLV
jgi:hypothetical protein